MAFDIDGTFSDMLDAAGAVLGKEGPAVQACVKRAFAASREALKAIADARLAGQLDDDEMQSELDDEARTLKAALLACKVKAKAAAQKAINAAMDVLVKAINAAL